MNTAEFIKNFDDEVNCRKAFPSTIPIDYKNEVESHVANSPHWDSHWMANVCYDYFLLRDGTPKEPAKEKPVDTLMELQNALGELVGDDSKHFTFDGVLRARPATDLTNPSTYSEVLESTTKLKNAQQVISNIAQWVFANVCHQIATAQGVEVLNIGNERANREANAALLTFRFFIDGKFKISWRHHQEIAHMRWLDKTTKLALAKAAEGLDWSIAFMRQVARLLQARAKTEGQPEDGNTATARVTVARIEACL